MTISISLSSETEAKLRERAVETGKDVSTLAREAVEEKFAAADGVRAEGQMSYQSWKAAFDAWVASHRPVGHYVDDSRESIYAGRGE